MRRTKSLDFMLFSNVVVLLLLQVKKDSDGNSKGFGFVRYKDYDIQMKVVAQRHMIDGRWCDVKIPDSRVGRNEVRTLSGSSM